MKSAAVWSVVFALVCAVSASAEVVELIDGTKMSGTIVHAYGNAIELKGEGGEVLVLHLNKVKQITYTKAEPRKELTSPEKAFSLYLDLIRQGKIMETVDCYRLMYQKMMAEQIAGMNEADKAVMQEEMVKTAYKIGTAAIEGRTARLTVTRTIDGKDEDAEIPFVKEDGEWRMAMMLMPAEEQDPYLENAVVMLNDGTEVKGEIIHVYAASYEIRGSDGQVIEFERGNIKSITVIHPDPRPQFATPEQTFSYYVALMKQGKIEETVECYRLMLQTVIAAQIAGMSAEDKVAVQKETGDTKFEYDTAKIDGEKAVLTVTRVAGKEKEAAEVVFVLENGEWKLSMPTSAGTE